MKRVILEELDKENTFFHFTRKENIKIYRTKRFNSNQRTKCQKRRNNSKDIFFKRDRRYSRVNRCLDKMDDE